MLYYYHLHVVHALQYLVQNGRSLVFLVNMVEVITNHNLSTNQVNLTKFYTTYEIHQPIC